jgi:O-antigen/teichoic acid export membrane protein
MKKTLIYYSVFYILLLVLQRGAGILTKMVLANSLTPFDYGVITLVAISLPSMFQFITNAFFYQMLSHSQEGRKYLGFTVWCSIIISILISLLLALFNKEFFDYLNLPLDQRFLYYVTIVISLFLVSIIIDFQGLFAGLKHYSLPAIIMTLPSIVRLFAVGLIVVLGINSFELVILIFALSNIIPLIYIFCSQEHRTFFSELKTICLPPKHMVAFGITLLLIGSLSSTGQLIIRLVISHMLGVVWQGYYDVSMTLAALSVFALGTMNYVSIPESTNPDKTVIYQQGGLVDVTRALFTVMILVLLLLYFYAETFVLILFSEEYLAGSKYVFILSIGYVFLFVQSYLQYLNLSNAKTQKDFIRISIIPFIALPLFYFVTEFLIIYFQSIGYDNGFIGAYLSYTILLGLVTGLTILTSKDLSPLYMLTHKIERLIISALIVFMILIIFKPSPLIGIFLIIVMFSGMVIALGYVNKSIIIDFINRKQAEE